ncbi:DUF2809 domain-containing protein [Clostridium sp. 19966]|uniref:ribosomal maturation YjgA family protein n=1 Tax=Clostridium sp. 19966 TaxID=2768166 RepID=UPI0028DFDBEE|nr:DUF2809 domain-containing protein [Clostridium sp. 19966]MDT8718940.1 DUF2809 domain-containing protein [Clostridium sp. 19966]
MTHKGNRLLYLFLTILVVLLGLSSRKLADHLPNVVNTYLGDTSWALMIFLGFAFLFKMKGTKFIAAISLAFSYAVEISQLYHAPWIDSIRRTTLGGLILGYGFQWNDLLSYTIGVVIGVIIDLLILNLIILSVNNRN